MEAAFIMILSQGDIFCANKGSKPLWIPTPHRDFLTKEFANRFSSIRIHRTEVDDDDSQPSNSMQSSSRNSADRAFCEALHSRLQSELDDLAEAVID